MTHNQIDYWNLVENIRHNKAMEELNRQDVETRAGTLVEASRHNIAEEGLTAAGIRQQDITSQRATAASRYASELGYSSSLYSADTSRYGYDLNAMNQRYNTDVSSATQRYGAELGYDASVYNTDIQSRNVERQAQATERGQSLNTLTNVWQKQLDTAYSWYRQNTDATQYIGKFNVDLSGGKDK